MVKKSTTVAKKIITKTAVPKKSLSKAELEQSLVDNFINLQKVLTNLAVKFDDLSNNIEKLLQLFEISAKSFAEKYSGENIGEQDKKFIDKLDSLLDQNKTIAKGIMLMEEKIRNRNPPSQLEQESRLRGIFKPKPLPKY